MKLYAVVALSLAALQGAVAFTVGGAALKARAIRRARSPAIAMVATTPTTRAWAIEDISPNDKLTQRIEGQTRKTWKFNDVKRDRVQVALESEGRPITADVQLWMGPDWTPFSLKTYSEDGKLRPVKTLVGTRNKEAMIEVQNKAGKEFPIRAASNYASVNMAKVPAEIPAMTHGTVIAGDALSSWSIEDGAKHVEVVLHTDGRQLNAKIELLNAPNNPKQVRGEGLRGEV